MGNPRFSPTPTKGLEGAMPPTAVRQKNFAISAGLYHFLADLYRRFAGLPKSSHAARDHVHHDRLRDRAVARRLHHIAEMTRWLEPRI